MTNQEELQYLTALILEASKWRISEGDDSDTIRLEVQDRIRRLTGINTTDENGLNQSEPAQEETESGEEDHPRGDKWRGWVEGRKRAWIDGGKRVWLPEEQTELIEFAPGKKKRVAKDSQEYRDYVEKQKDQMWEEHNAENS